MALISDDFYASFENEFRGNYDLIINRLKVYFPLLELAKESTNNKKVLDLGCGRGEWLDLVRASGFESFGVDTNTDFAEACRARGHEILIQDALAALQEQPANSVSVVSAFHLIEHIAPADFITLVTQAHRILETGGILILETPNIENFGVASSSFYLDPTHLRPIPIEYAKFVARNLGFAQVDALRLQEDPAIHDKEKISISDVLYGSSPDYSLVAMKSGNIADHAAFSRVSEKLVGSTTDGLAKRFEFRMQKMETEISSLEEELADIRHSRSWRITHPLRKLSSFLSSLKK